MIKLEELEERINSLEKENKLLKMTNERLDKTVFELEQNLARIKYLNINIIENLQNKNLLSDIEYICLKLYVGVEEHQKMLELPFHIERKYRETGEYPTLQEYHELLIKTLNLSEDEIDNFTIKTTLALVEEKVNLGGLTVFDKILKSYKY